MKTEKRDQQKQTLKALGETLFQELKNDEHMTLSYSGEDSLFIRINQAKVRQASEVTQGHLSLDFFSGSRHTEMTLSLTRDLEEDVRRALKALQQCRKDCETLPEDPYCIFPEKGDTSEEDHFGECPDLEMLPEILLEPAKSYDLAGLFTSGTLFRAYVNSKGQCHWFSTDNFYFDYSLYTPSQKAIKATYAGRKWNGEDYLFSLQQAKSQLRFLDPSARKLAPGKYRAYFAPAAVAEFVMGLSWSGLSGQALMQGRSPLKKLSEGEANLSPLFSLGEDFHMGLAPRFNEFGDLSSLKIPLISEGQLISPLVNRRTAQEYNLTSNAANSHERLRSPKIHPGTLKESAILSKLGTGLYISNLHYLNWSDLQHGRLTGMTRYGCFWVERGEIASPIYDMRFDETLYHFFGEGLESLNEKAELIPHISSYGERSLGGVSVPGLLVNDFSFTL